MLFSARYSWVKPITALRKAITARILHGSLVVCCFYLVIRRLLHPVCQMEAIILGAIPQ